ncbi:NUDIX hydrolase [Vibrio sp. JC009]|uniref:NUDIX hydrolase n=1 Tax=Vibrio sp. JC009 TaxID=2912314 RepID=UPI0023B0B0FF|nr:NUDIX hydrolase [Vibrio sp. JC009]WED24971.1 NUDIX hydrolase [Vibrio sp. JC009]
MMKVIHQWKNIQLVEEKHTLPNDKEITHTSITHPGAAVILPITEDGRILVTHQYRPSINRWIIELPAGTVENGEEPLLCAQRELEEETGYSATNFVPLGELTPLAGFCDEIQFLYIATGLEKTQRLECDPDEVIETKVYSLQELENLILENIITDSKTIAALFRAKLAGFLR